MPGKIVKDHKNLFINDKETKPAAIEQRIGRIPIFVAGNVRTGGDIAQLTYSETNSLPNFQLLINHDDDVREFAYAEKDNASLNAAEEGGWHVVSMKNDWLKIFPFENWNLHLIRSELDLESSQDIWTSVTTRGNP